MYREVRCIKVDEGSFTATDHAVVEEVAITLTVNGRTMMTAMASPDMVEEFIVGFLYTEQIIKSIDEIESIKREKNTVGVLTKNPFKVIGTKKIILSGCGGSSSFLDTRKLPHIASELAVTQDMIVQGLKQVMNSSLHRLTGGVHVIGLMTRNNPVRIAEDIGRHNALDKVIGFALKKGVDLSETFVVSSGRISSEMVRKCLVANIPIIVSRGATTTLAVDIAETTGLCIVGFARGGKMNIYTHPERIEGASATYAKTPNE
ncbi:MAG: formate dehydrogenase accessory sulfurtransferase FdhD [Methanomicrobiales archaeon]|nr:formate dehydrogenase accessory sulfurtransferase FdhD [Methanomicrobiales archaeon]